MKRLVICEKPSVARAVAIGLNIPMTGGLPYSSEEWIVDAARGHLLQLAYPDEYDPSLKEWSAEDLPFIPETFEWKPRSDSGAEERLERLVGHIRSGEVTEVVNACDAGREGELIFKLIFRAADTEVPVRRAWFSSLTPGAVRRAFDDLRDDAEMRGLEDAAMTRDIGDWLIGINGTRAATVRARSGAPEKARGPISVGRVQTPSLRILVERELEIDAYEPIPFYRVAGTLTVSSGSGTIPTLMVDEEGDALQFDTSESAEQIAQSLKGKPASVEAYDVEEVERKAPLPFDLATLQVEASRAFGWSAARTLREAQRLYENQYISYPRTDSRFLTWDLKGQVIDALGRVPAVLPELKDESERLQAAARDGTLSGRPFNSALVRDHHAIIPTGKSGAETLAENPLKLYELVARRFVAAFLSPSLEERHTLRARVDDRTFGASGWRLLESGWRGVEPGREATDPDELEALEAFGGGEADAQLSEAMGEERHPWRPRPHTDGSLIRAMERAGEEPEEDRDEAGRPSDSPAEGSGSQDEAPDEEEDDDSGERHVGIGTPATRSGIIETLIDRRYARRYRRWIYATVRGRRLIDLLDDLELGNPQLTARWEERLEAIRDGGESREVFQKELEELTRRTVEAILARPMENLYGDPLVVGPCPQCEGEIVERDKAFGCNSWVSPEEPGCGWVVFRETTNGRVGRSEAELRLRQDRPHSRGQGPTLPPGTAGADETLPGVEVYRKVEGEGEPLANPFLEDSDPDARTAWERAIAEVVAVEGPVMLRRVLAVLEPRAKDLSARKAKKAVNRISSAMVQENRLQEVDDARTPEGQQDKIFRLPGTDPEQPDVRPRTRGPRDGLEIPQREIRAVWDALGRLRGEDGLMRLAEEYEISEDQFGEEYRKWFGQALGDDLHTADESDDEDELAVQGQAKG